MIWIYYDIDLELLCFGIGSRGARPSENFSWMFCDGLAIGLIMMDVQVVMST